MQGHVWYQSAGIHVNHSVMEAAVHLESKYRGWTRRVQVASKFNTRISEKTRGTCRLRETGEKMRRSWKVAFWESGGPDPDRGGPVSENAFATPLARIYL